MSQADVLGSTLGRMAPDKEAATNAAGEVATSLRKVDGLFRADAIARAILALQPSARSVDSYTIENALGCYFGRLMIRQVGALIGLSERLAKHKAAGMRAYDFGYADRYAESIVHRRPVKGTLPPEVAARLGAATEFDAGRLSVFLMRAQSYHYAVFVHESSIGYEDATELHIRFTRRPAGDGASMSVDAVRHVAEGQTFERFGDVDGVRYLDARDPGYVVSIRRGLCGHEVDKATWVPVATLEYVWHDLMSAVETARTE